MCELLVGLPDVTVLGIVDEMGGPLWIHVETGQSAWSAVIAVGRW